MKKTAVALAIIACALGLLSSGGKTSAATGASLTGWGWSSNIGWVYFGPTSVGGGVTVSTTTANPTSGTFGGYAWSSNLGWLSFENTDATACGGTATINLTSGQVAGWARLLTEKNIGGSKPGCVELSGTNHPSPSNTTYGGVTFNKTTGAITGFAWGSDDIGWLQFTSVSCPGCIGGGTQSTDLVASCTVLNSTTNTDNSKDVSFTVATPSNGTAPYAYKWGNGSYATSTTAAPTNTFGPVHYSSTQDGPTVSVQDSAGNSKNMLCPNVVIGGGPGGNGTCSISYNPLSNMIEWSKNGYSSCQLYTFTGTGYTAGATSSATNVSSASGSMSPIPSTYTRYSIFCPDLSAYRANPTGGCYNYSETGSTCTGAGCGTCLPGQPCNGNTNPGNSSSTETEI